MKLILVTLIMLIIGIVLQMVGRQLTLTVVLVLPIAHCGKLEVRKQNAN